MKLHLVLKAKWYDMIVTGEKPYEYRDFNKYWIKRIWMKRKIIQSIVFHRAYTNITHERKNKGIFLGYGLPRWGAEKNKQYICIGLGEEVKQ